MKNLLLKIMRAVEPQENLTIMKARLQKEMHIACMERNFNEAEKIGNRLLVINRSLNKK